ncbi:MAG: hypothetical protein COV70_00250 [Parcubacteria group bacterium CG11_big_fil_rev_8_21_14_0_20_39_22]|nr:MAG: hypothetical protein COV70_00250 [Parcubacteria group bacterium CG11_big_fil_rev_8_21_14_0_20_39_22]
MRILITTGIYPPAIGGPAQYAKNLSEAFERGGHTVSIRSFSIEKNLPTGLRHLLFLFRIIPSVITSDIVVAFDTFSVGLPSVVVAKLLGKKIVIRTGGDFLWEGYVERTGEKVLLRDFYNKSVSKFSAKERVIFRLTHWTLRNSDKIIFSTDWQRQIWRGPYNLDMQNTSIVENYYGPKESSKSPRDKVFIGGTRKIKWKNIDMLYRAFNKAKETDPELKLDVENSPYDEFVEKIRQSYAVILVSLGDISPNMILDSIRLNKPFVVTKEVGIYERIKNIGIFVDPKDEEDIRNAIISLSDSKIYHEQKEKIEQFNFVHTYDEIAREFLDIFEDKTSFHNSK